MKRLTTFIIAITLCLLVHAKHLEFMGIPITGSITTFQTKLQAKGCTLSKNNNLLPTGIRGFKGVFAGKDCDIFVWFNHKTKQVYQVRAVTESLESLDQTHNLFYYFKNLLNQKYLGKALTSDLLEDSSFGEFDFEVVVLDRPYDGDFTDNQIIGTIVENIISYDSYISSYSVAITYEDLENSSKNDENTLDDL